MTLEQQRAVALASARLRLQQQGQPAAQSTAPEPFVPSGEKSSGWLGHLVGYSPQELGITPEENIAGHPVTRFAVGAASPFLGIAQLIAEALGDPTGTETLKRFEAAKERGMKAMGGEGVDVAGLAGSVVSPAVMAATKVPAAASVLGRAGQGAAIGGGLGAAAPVTDTGDYWAAKGAQIGAGTLIGGAVPPAIDAVRGGARLVRNIADPFLPGGVQRSASRLLDEVAGAKRAAIEAELAAPKVIVPGSLPTATEAATGAGSAEFAGLQRIGEQRKPTEFLNISRAQEAARRGALGGIAKDSAALKAAEAARASEAGELYGAARQQTVKADAGLNILLKRPSMEKALARAAELAEEAGQKFTISAGQPAQQVPSRILGPSGAPASVTRIAEKPAEYPVTSLHHIKTALDDMVKNPERFGIGATEARAIENTKRLYLKWFEDKVPAYKVAREAYARASKPINVMEVGQELEKALTKPLGTSGERAGVFAGAVREAPRTLKKATGQPRFERLEEVLDAGDYQTVKDVLADLARKAEHETLERAGAGRAAEITAARTLPATGPLNQTYMVIKTVLGRVTRGITDKTLDEIADALQVPSKTLKLLKMTPDVQRSAVMDAIIQRKLGRGAIAAGTVLSAEGAQQ